jgi:hypothetical protein
MLSVVQCHVLCRSDPLDCSALHLGLQCDKSWRARTARFAWSNWADVNTTRHASCSHATKLPMEQVEACSGCTHWQGYVNSTLRVGCITRASQISRQESHTSCCCGRNSTPGALAYHLLTLSPILHFASHRFVLDLPISAPDARYRVIRVTGLEAPHAHWRTAAQLHSTHAARLL